VTVATPYQQRCLHIPEEINLNLHGGRGSGKTTALLLLIIRHCEKYGEKARPLVVRPTYRGLLSIEEQLLSMLLEIYPKTKHNKSEHIFRLPNGAMIELGQLDSMESYNKFQGRINMTMACADEYGTFAERRYFDLLRSNLRSNSEVPLRVIITCNPGGPRHSEIHSEHIAAALPWHPYTHRDGTEWVHCPGDYRSNPHLPANYVQSLIASANGDPALIKCWRDGDWSSLRGSFFGGHLDTKVHMLPAAFPYELRRPYFHTFMAMDWGLDVPSVCYVCAIANGDLGFPKNTLLLLDEFATVSSHDMNQGLRYSPGALAEGMHEMADRWGCSKEGVCDDSAGLGTSLLEVFLDHGFYFQKPAKQRRAGWAAMKELLWNTSQRNGKPQLLISERCRYFWSTAPTIPRDELRPDDCSSAGADHAVDACRYAVMELIERTGMSSKQRNQRGYISPLGIHGAHPIEQFYRNEE
jgi:hypothetical protein